MEQIGENVYIEEDYPGVTLGVITLPEGVLMIDAPFRSEDVNSWRGKLGNLGGGVEKLLVILDTHVDRMLGIQAMGFTTLCHEESVEILHARSSTIRPQDLDSVSDLEIYDQPTNIQWAIPKMTYAKQTWIHWDVDPIKVVHRPGAHISASWVQYEANKVIFVGDSVMSNQPPFIGWSQLDLWIEELNWLRSEAFKGYKIVAGREGVVNRRAIGKTITFLTKVQKMMQDLSLSGGKMDDIRSVSSHLLKNYDFEPDLLKCYSNRLVSGLENYHCRHHDNGKEKTQGVES